LPPQDEAQMPWRRSEGRAKGLEVLRIPVVRNRVPPCDLTTQTHRVQVRGEERRPLIHVVIGNRLEVEVGSQAEGEETREDGPQATAQQECRRASKPRANPASWSFQGMIALGVLRQRSLRCINSSHPRDDSGNELGVALLPAHDRTP